jgi:hypothetical protein
LGFVAKARKPELRRYLRLRVPPLRDEVVREHIRKYNLAFAFASFGAKIVQSRGYGPYCFKIHNQIYYQTIGIHSNPPISPKYCQLYILENVLIIIYHSRL